MELNYKADLGLCLIFCMIMLALSSLQQVDMKNLVGPMEKMNRDNLICLIN